ncbi:MAG: hypothetical protein LBF40_03145 [Deltaproteobacteria bacterium]|nr:hypothetical protein [Deltaproteobacteria bacterium]
MEAIDVIVYDPTDIRTIPKPGEVIHVLDSENVLSGRCFVMPKMPDSYAPVILLQETSTMLAMKDALPFNMFEPWPGTTYFQVHLTDEEKRMADETFDFLTDLIAENGHKIVDREF